MQYTDVAIVGGGLAGSLAAAMLGGAGYDALLIDPHGQFPPDFRVEKLDDDQVGILEKTGLADTVRRMATPYRELWLAGYGRVFDKRPVDQLGFLYDALVNTLRAAIPQAASFIEAKVTAITTGVDRQTLQLSNGEEISARLVVLASGLNIGLRHKLGLTREVISANHSIAIGFDMKPHGRPAFEFPAMTYLPEHRADHMAYLTMFPTGQVMRANLMGYRDLNDPWMRQLRDAPQDTIYGLMPGLRKFLGDFEVTDFIKVRPVDLYVTGGHRQGGIVLVGDAFATSCPAAGTGARKALNDVERLCNVHIPDWLTTPGMATDKIAAFYDDPVKRECDEQSLAKAFSLRSLSIDTALRWRLERRARYVAYEGLGIIRQARRWLAARRHAGSPAPTARGSSSPAA